MLQLLLLKYFFEFEQSKSIIVGKKLYLKSKVVCWYFLNEYTLKILLNSHHHRQIGPLYTKHRHHTTTQPTNTQQQRAAGELESFVM